ncbi:hypothetical protein BC629DRAFT_930785 [Irpex lacteus]|nr:hypothetical protein BC629DRAFT_930785 [Irpex lacteus]
MISIFYCIRICNCILVLRAVSRSLTCLDVIFTAFQPLSFPSPLPSSALPPSVIQPIQQASCTVMLYYDLQFYTCIICHLTSTNVAIWVICSVAVGSRARPYDLYRRPFVTRRFMASQAICSQRHGVPNSQISDRCGTLRTLTWLYHLAELKSISPRCWPGDPRFVRRTSRTPNVYFYFVQELDLIPTSLDSTVDRCPAE